MADNPHPVDSALIDFCIVRRQLVQDFVADDGVINASEQEIIERFNEAVSTVAQDRKVERAIAYLTRVEPGNLSDYGKRLFGEAGFSIEPLDAA